MFLIKEVYLFFCFLLGKIVIQIKGFFSLYHTITLYPRRDKKNKASIKLNSSLVCFWRINSEPLTQFWSLIQSQTPLWIIRQPQTRRLCSRCWHLGMLQLLISFTILFVHVWNIRTVYYYCTYIRNLRYD